MLWPDDELLREQQWWTEPAWEHGASWGALVAGLRPALRAALLLGYQVDSIDVSHGEQDAGSSAWRSLDVATLAIDPARELPDERSFAGPNVRLGAFEVADLAGLIDGSFATGLAPPAFGTDELVSSEEVPAEVLAGVEGFVEEAVAALAAGVDVGSPPARAAGAGLVWMLDPAHWRGLDDERVAPALAPVTDELLSNAAAFLRGQLHGDRTRHVGPEIEPEPGPANLLFLQQRGAGLPDHAGLWRGVAASLQARGEAHRLPERARHRLAHPGRAPTWLDVLSELVWRGVVLVDGLVEAPDPPDPIEVAGSEAGRGDELSEIVLAVWGGDEQIVLRREVAFDDEGNEGLEGSVAWDYVPGDEQTRPTVVVVAGRGVAIEHGWRAADRRPWTLAIHRVQDDSLVPSPGAAIDPAVLLGTSLLDPPIESADARLMPRVLVRPKPDGVLLQFPAWGTTGPTGPVSGQDVPRVVELTVDPRSGTAAYALDVHYYTYPAGSYTAGGAHLCVWATPGVVIQSNDSPSDAERGDPSQLSEDDWLLSWRYSAELWEATPPERLPRPWSAVLPLTESAAARPDLLAAVPRLDYRGGDASVDGVTLVPALHSYKQFGWLDSLAYSFFDLLIGFVPYVGDVVDIGEAVWAWQTGRDKWGRPMSDLELALTIVGAGVPLVSGSFLREVGQLVAATPVDDVPLAELGRLAAPAPWDDDFPLEQVEAARGVSETLQPGRVTSSGRRDQAAALIDALAGAEGAVADLARRLVGDGPAGWVTVGDVIDDAGDGFAIPVLQTAYLRYLRDNPGAADTPAEFVERLVADGG